MHNKKKLVIILGAHRSGTSLCAAGLDFLGLDLGIEDNYSNKENRKGFFEQVEIVNFNNQLLSHLGGSWDNFLFDGARAIANSDLTSWHVQAKKIFLKIFKDTKFAVIKDPRMCQLLSFWKPVFQDCGYLKKNVYFIYTIRDPVEVALSQYQRANDTSAFYEIGKCIQEGAILWMALTAQALAQGIGCNNYILSYHALLTESEKELRQLANFLVLTPDDDQIFSFCNEFVDTALYRSKSNLKAQEIVFQSSPQVIEFYNKLKKLLKKREFGSSEIKPILKYFESSKTNSTIIEAAIPVISRLSESCRNERSIVIQNKAKIKEINSRLKSLSDDRDQMKLAYQNEKTILIKEQAAAVESQMAEIARLQSDSADLQTQLQALIDDRDQMNLAYENEKTILIKEQAAAVESQMAEIARLQSDSADLQTQLRALIDDRDQMKLAYENEKTILIKEQAAAGESQMAEIARLQSDSADLQAQLQALIDDREQMKLAYENEKTLLIKEQAAAVESQMAEIARLQSDSADLQTQLQALIDDRDQMKLAYENEKTLLIKEQVAAVESQMAEIARQQSDSADLQTQLQALIDDRDQMKLAYENEKTLLIKEQAAAVESQMAEIARLQSDSADPQTQLQALIDDRDQMKQTYEDKNTLLIEQHAVTVKSMKDKAADLKAEKCVIQDELKILVIEKEQLNKNLQQLIHTLALMKNSVSWKVAVPLRAIKNKYIKLKRFPVKFWLKVKQFSHRAHISLLGRSPWLANLLKSMLLPFFRLINQIVLGSSYPLSIESAVYAHNGPIMQMDYQQPCLVELYQPLVSIIVPNYNHVDFLQQRLDSIFSQSYKHFEVILMDDCSEDGSSKILQEYHDRYAEKSTLILNDKNSGGVFYQWEKGLKQAAGDIIWMAESDDWCTENFLETLVPFFQNEAIQLAYTKTIFMDGSGVNQIWSINEYLHDIDPDRWDHVFVETAHKLVSNAFAIKNIVPNVSSALFRNPKSLEILKQKEWKAMRTCGDWVLYLHLIRGGMVAYSPDAHNYYRIHENNTSVTSYAEDSFYIEHEVVAKTIQQYFKVDESVFEKQYSNLVTHWKQTRSTFSEDAFERCYSLDRIKKEPAKRHPNLLMAGYAFCAGGGETFPIQLANLMKSKGYNITFLDCAQEPRIENVRQSLRLDIPVISNYPDLQRIVENFGIDLIHSHHAWVDNTILDILPENTDCKTMVTLHGMYETIDDNSLKSILPRLVRRSAKIVYTAEKNLTALKNNNLIKQANPLRIDNALEVATFSPLDRSELGIPEEAFLLTLVSRAIPEKGWLEAIEAVTLARKQSGKEIHLILIGEGPVYNELKKEKISSFIHLEGFRVNIRSYFASSQMGFLPSRFHGESFPLVLIDCLQVGRPVLASSVGEISYMLGTEEGKAGEVFDLNSWEIPITDLADRIVRLATDSHYYQNLLEKVPAAAKKFDPELLKDNYHAAYSGALSKIDSAN